MGSHLKELVIVGVDDRNWKGIGIALLVIASILSLIGLAIFIITPKGDNGNKGIYKLELEDITLGRLKAKLFNGSWISGHEFVYEDDQGGISLFNARQNSTITLVHNSIIRQHNVQSFEISADRLYVSLKSETRKDPHLTTVSRYQIHNVSNEYMVEDLTSDLKEPNIQYLSWSPVHNSIVFVSANDIYYIPSIGAKAQRLTSTGIKGLVYNGIADWLYSANVFENPGCVWWAKDGSAIIYASFNDTLVPTHPIKLYGTLQEVMATRTFIPEIVLQRYTKAGLQGLNPEVSLWYLNLAEENPTSKQILPPDEIRGKEPYLSHVRWIDEQRILVIWTIRNQNYTTISICSRNNDWACQEVTAITDKMSTLKDLSRSILIPNQGEVGFLRTSRPDSLIGSYFHVATFDLISNGKRKNFITHGDFDVSKLLAFSQETNTLYYRGSVAGKPGEEQIYSISLDSNRNKQSVCLSCHLSSECNYYDALFSPTAEFFVLSCLGPVVPYTELWESGQNLSKMVTLIENSELRAVMALKKMPSTKILLVPLDSLSAPATVRILIPPPKELKPKKEEEEEEEEIPKHPLVIQSVSIGVKTITNRFDVSWREYLASKKEYIYANIDIEERHLQNQARLQKKYNYELQLQVVKHLSKEVEEIDSRRIAIWGVGAAGFNALSALETDAGDLLKCAIGVAPVINWRYMDSVTAEHFLGMTSVNENFAAYEHINLMTKTSGLVGKRFLVIHGTADDNIHVQHTMMLTKALIHAHKAGPINYQIQLYPDDDHEMSHSKFHYYKLMESYLDICLARRSSGAPKSS